MRATTSIAILWGSYFLMIAVCVVKGRTDILPILVAIPVLPLVVATFVLASYD